MTRRAGGGRWGRAAGVALIGLALLAGCSPSLNWREVAPVGAAVRLMFPCKPEHEDRAQPGPGGRPMMVRSLSCKAQDAQFSLTWVDLGTPKEVPAALVRLRENVAQVLAPGASAPVSIPGMTADPGAQQQQWTTRDPQPQQVRQAIFAREGRVYQLLLQSPQPNPDAWETFLASVTLG